MNGNLGILNVGAGDFKISFDPSKPKEREHAAKVVGDMLKRGYAILVRAGETKDGKPLYLRAESFDPETCEYIVVGAPDDDEPAPRKGLDDGPPIVGPNEPVRRGRGRPPKARLRIAAHKTSAVAVARSAGG